MCGKLFKLWRKYYLMRFPEDKKYVTCDFQPHRNAGDSPECWYYNELADPSMAPNWTANADEQRADCIHLNGSNYHGNISVTSSGITCQSWTEQCPHRHTMNTTYPELNLAKNYCRNPQNSGQRPWCFTTDRNKRWEYCDIPKCIPVDGNYGNWSLNSSCSVTCGDGIEIWRRECDNPQPKYGGRNCNQLGKTTKYRNCTRKPCVVNGNYSRWYLSSKCNVSCGEGSETWRRSCDNPAPKNGGQNCSVLGEEMEYRICRRQPCLINGNYSNWTKSAACSVTCGKGYELWSRECDNPPPKYGGDCSKYGVGQETRPCHNEPCPVKSSSKTISISCGVSASIIILAIGFLFIGRRRILSKRPRRGSFRPYAINIFGSRTRERTTSESALIRDATTGERIYESIEELDTSERIYESIEELNTNERIIYESIDDINTRDWRGRMIENMQEMKTSEESSTSTSSDEVA